MIKHSELPVIRLGRDVCGDLIQAEAREWWLSNGRGSYAAGTVAGILSRRYHGLLVAPLSGPLHRHLLLSKADAWLCLDARRSPLFSNRWQGNVIEPSGYLHLESFQLEGRMPVWRFAFGDRTLEMRIWMEAGETTSYVAYRLQGPCCRARLEIDLLVNRRDHHHNMPVDGMRAEVLERSGRLIVRWPEGEQMQLYTSPGRFDARLSWYQGFLLAREQERGLAAVDNHLCIGRLTLELPTDRWVGFAATLEHAHRFDPYRRMQVYLQREQRLLEQAVSADPCYNGAPEWVRQLLLAADSFLIRRPMSSGREGDSVIAGYPWFGDWGRDTMIALPGLTLATGRPAIARAILDSYAALLDRGQLPNRFVEAGDRAEYNTVDASLWYIEAWRAYLEVSNDRQALAEVFPVLQQILHWYRQGTRYGIAMDSRDHLIRAGEEGVQLTWMDAKAGDWVVTPRIGKPVEINALWYNALCCMADFAARLEQPAAGYRQLAEAVRSGFQQFLRPDGQGLYDVLEGPQGDEQRLRPNQILAVSLPHSPLEREQQAQVVSICGRELLCSHGLRSLARHDPDYRGEYRGDVLERDGAYHQGTVWGWLLGHYAMAEFRVTGDARAAQARLRPMADHLQDTGLGTLSEIFDGDPPHLPRGAPAQAWSVACTLEAWWRLQQLDGATQRRKHARG
ncbi:MAG: amylo-alpha-1,6-glucosidase [Chromatiales bacterium]|jgi:4-alpha-glucanotransferase